MSYDAVDWGLSVEGITPTEKFILVVLCHAYNPENGCFPSIQTLMRTTGFSKPSVCKALASLESSKLIARSRMKTKTGFVNRYELLGFTEGRSTSLPRVKSEPRLKSLPRQTSLPEGRSKSLPTGRSTSLPLISKGTSKEEQVNVYTRDASLCAEQQNDSIPDDGPSYVTDTLSSDSYSEVTSTSGGSSVSDCGSAVSSREDTFELTPNEPPAKPAPKKGAKRSNLAARPDDVSEEVWADYQTLRKAKRAPVTDTVIKGLRREAEAAGITIDKAMAWCAENGYQGFKAAWYQRDQNQSTGSSGYRYQKDRSHFAHEKPDHLKDFSPDEQQQKDMAEFFAKKKVA